MRTDPVTRDDVLTLLSDDEMARVNTVGTALRLSQDDEYVDLEQLDQGVRRAVEMTTFMGRFLPRKALHENTWTKVLTVLGSRGGPSAVAGT